jgi:trehalose/maltose hydrolase-like predicted phosphorylase
VRGGALGELRPLLHDQRRADGWIVRRPDSARPSEDVDESVCAQTNGLLGIRATSDEHPVGTTQGTFVAGVFAPGPAGAEDLVVCPDLFTVSLRVDGHGLAEGWMLDSQTRELDLRDLSLQRFATYHDARGRICCVRSTRIASLADPSLAAGVLEISTPEGPLEIEVEVGLRQATEHALLPVAHVIGARAEPLPVLRVRAGAYDVAAALAVSASSGERVLDVASARTTGAGALVTYICSLDAGAPLHIERVACVRATGDGQEIADEAAQGALDGLRNGDERWSAHRAAWRRRWEEAAVEVAGDPPTQLGVRFSVAQLAAVAPPAGVDASIAAKGLSGPGYKGHVFWDTEVYMVPFYSLVLPDVARRLLEYRVARLDAARERAADAGLRGAWYPWESAATGRETTPSSIIGPDGRTLEVWSGVREIHLGAAIAWAVDHHLRATGDEELRAASAPMIADIARFYAGWARRTPRGYEILGVIGPDEYHHRVDNSAYTNTLAAWTMRLALRLAEQGLVEMDEAARGELRAVADGLLVIRRPDGIIEQHEGFFALPDPPPGWRHGQGGEPLYRHVKQADVVMLMRLLPSLFSREELARHYAVYEPLTTHGSSLSEAMHSLVARWAGLNEEADGYLDAAVAIDLADTHRNGKEGLHLATHGGIWQAVACGCAGLDPRDDGLHVTPVLPARWSRLTLPVRYRGSGLRVHVERDVARVELEEGEPVPVALAGRRAVVARGRPLEAPR